MKANWLALTFLLLLTVAGQVTAQQNEADCKLLADIRAKAEKGDAQSQCALGLAFGIGQLGVARDYVEAVKWFRKAAEQKLAEAQCCLGDCYADERPRRAPDQRRAAGKRKLRGQKQFPTQFL